MAPTSIDRDFEAARGGDAGAFTTWMRAVERPLRASLRAYARAADIEGVVQEALIRMWVLARDGGRELVGEDASLRFAIGLARNLARNEARRFGRLRFLPPADVPETAVPPDPGADPGLARALRECLDRLAAQPLVALQARLANVARSADREIAALVGMTFDTFRQNLSRARAQLRACLEGKGVPLDEVLR